MLSGWYQLNYWRKMRCKPRWCRDRNISEDLANTMADVALDIEKVVRILSV